MSDPVPQAHGGALTPFEPGQSGNPAGKPKGIPNSKTRLLRLLELTQDIKNPVTGEVEGFTVMEQIDMKLIQKARNGDLGAIRELLDRLEGKAQQKVDVGLEGQLNVALVQYIGEDDDDNKDTDTDTHTLQGA